MKNKHQEKYSQTKKGKKALSRAQKKYDKDNLTDRRAQKKEYMPQVSKERQVICFNYYRDGELINIKYRDGEKIFKQVKDAEKIFYGLDDIYSKPKKCAK